MFAKAIIAGLPGVVWTLYAAFVVSNLGVAASWFKVAAVSGVYVLFAMEVIRATGGLEE